MKLVPRNNNLGFSLFDNMFDDMFRDPFFTSSNTTKLMKTDIQEKDDKYILDMDLPGYDKDDIKAWITQQHHYFCYELKCIDDFSLDCIEKRFKHYQDENGNSFVENLMNELRTLPKQPPID